MVNSKLLVQATNTTLLVLHGRTDVAIRVNSKLVFKASNMMFLVLHGRTDVATQVNNKPVFRAANMKLLALHGRTDVAIRVNSKLVLKANNMVAHWRWDVRARVPAISTDNKAVDLPADVRVLVAMATTTALTSIPWLRLRRRVSVG
jgi:hypothetical protein